jgi:Cathepsin propeptide inhibitor domain (I29)
MAKFAILTLVVLSTVATFAAQDASADDFNKWKDRYDKSYQKKDGKTEAAARKNFEKNVAAINKHNNDPDATYKQKANSHADMTQEEFERTRCGYKPSNETSKKVKSSNGNGIVVEEEIKKMESNKKVKGAGDPASLDYSRYVFGCQTFQLPG